MCSVHHALFVGHAHRLPRILKDVFVHLSSGDQTCVRINGLCGNREREARNGATGQRDRGPVPWLPGSSASSARMQAISNASGVWFVV